MNKTSPFLTMSPSSNFASVRYTLTFGRTSTVPKGARRPVYSSQSFTSRCSAAVTVTTGGGSAPAFFSCRQPGPNTTAKIPKGRVILKRHSSKERLLPREIGGDCIHPYGSERRKTFESEGRITARGAVSFLQVNNSKAHGD